MEQLVETWVEAEREGYSNSLGQAIRELNEATDSKIHYSRIAEYRKGVHAPSPKVISYMLWRVLPWALMRIGHKATDPQLDALEDLLWLVDVKDGDRTILHAGRPAPCTPSSPPGHEDHAPVEDGAHSVVA